MSELLELAARCEAAQGPDRELDLSIDLACGRERDFPFGEAWGPGYHFKRGQTTVEVLDQPGREVAQWFAVPRYTASLDAAMTLVPEDYRLSSFGEEAYDDEPRPWAATLSARAGRFGAMGKYARAATPALALCAAALRARSTQGDQ